MNRLRGIAFLLLLAVWPFGQARADKVLEALKPFLRTHCLESVSYTHLTLPTKA